MDSRRSSGQTNPAPHSNYIRSLHPRDSPYLHSPRLHKAEASYLVDLSQVPTSPLQMAEVPRKMRSINTGNELIQQTPERVNSQHTEGNNCEGSNVKSFEMNYSSSAEAAADPNRSKPELYQSALKNALRIVTPFHSPAEFCTGISIFLSILLLLGATGYLALGLICVFDKRGKDVYFTTNPNEFDLPTGLSMKIATPSLKIQTDNWGYFQVAFGRVVSDKDNAWGKYDCFLAILLTVSIVSVAWIVLGVIRVCSLVNDWVGFECKGLVIMVFSFLAFCGGNGYIFYRIYLFNQDYEARFDKCDCESFKDDYYRSIRYYFVTTCVAAGVGLMNVLTSLALRCRTRPAVVPKT